MVDILVGILILTLLGKVCYWSIGWHWLVLVGVSVGIPVWRKIGTIPILGTLNLGEDVNKLFFGPSKWSANLSITSNLLNKVTIYLNVLCLVMENMTISNKHRSTIVIIHGHRIALNIKLPKKILTHISSHEVCATTRDFISVVDQTTTFFFSVVPCD